MPLIAFAVLILAVIAAAGATITLVQAAGVSLVWLGIAALGVAVLVRGLVAWK